MPLYEYYCKTCDVVTEEQRPVDARLEPAVCSKCLLPKAELAPSLSTFILKGTGWAGGFGTGSPLD